MGIHFYFILQPLLAFQIYFLVQLYWWSLSFFLRVHAIHWLFLMVSFGFHPLRISERSFVLFLKLSLFVVSFVLYNCILWFRRTHGSVKTSYLKENQWRSGLYWLKWSEFPEIISSLLTLSWEMNRQTWKMTFPWQIFGSSEMCNCMS